MPELPEVETMRRGIAHLAGLRIDAAAFPRRTRRPISVSPAPRTLAAQLIGRSIVAVHRYGKRVGIELMADRHRPRQWLVMEPRMTGQLLVTEPPTTVHVRLELVLASRRVPRLIFWDRRGLGTVTLLVEAGLQSVCGPQRLGIDGLVVTAASLQRSLGESRRAVKPALLDQRAVAGIGNI